MALGRGAELPVNPHVAKFGVGISWDKGQFAVDVDLQAVIVDQKGVRGTEFADFGLFFSNASSRWLSRHI